MITDYEYYTFKLKKLYPPNLAKIPWDYPVQFEQFDFTAKEWIKSLRKSIKKAQKAAYREVREARKYAHRQ